jgi:hypothetical protein
MTRAIAFETSANTTMNISMKIHHHSLNFLCTVALLFLASIAPLTSLQARPAPCTIEDALQDTAESIKDPITVPVGTDVTFVLRNISEISATEDQGNKWIASTQNPLPASTHDRSTIGDIGVTPINRSTFHITYHLGTVGAQTFTFHEKMDSFDSNYQLSNPYIQTDGTCTFTLKVIGPDQNLAGENRKK